MKRLFAISVILIFFLGLASGCTNKIQTNVSNKTQSPKVETTESQETILVQSEFDNQTTNTSKQNEGFGGGLLTVQKYRTRFYSIPGTFVNLVGKENYFEWIYTVDYTSSAERMLMPQFIKHFGITREQFDKANLEFAKIVKDGLDGRPCLNPKDYANQIDDEIFNGDIIFTFNDQTINEYYLSPEFPYLYNFEFDEAVANGEYTSQTEEWVDVEQMEAEIIAKYGEAEQVEESSENVYETETTESAEVQTASEKVNDE